MKKEKGKNIIKDVLIIIFLLLVLFILRMAVVLGIVSLSLLIPKKDISGIENYDKKYYINEYRGDLDSNLSIFPDNKSNMIEADFSSSFQTNFFDTDGYIILIAKYNKEDFSSEINRLKGLSMTIYANSKDNAESYTNYVRYDEKSYKYPAYITIDGFGHTYEYALINEEESEIIYIYLSYPKEDNIKYRKYLKSDLSLYSITDTIDMYSMYNHSFDNGKIFIEFDDNN